MKFSVSLGAVFGGSGMSTEEKIRKSAELGFPAIEFWAWWNEDLELVARVTKECGIAVASVCTRFVSLVDAARRAEYIEGLRESIEAARRLGCRYLISQTGDELAGVDRSEQAASLVAGLKEAAPLLEAAGVTLVVEPLNTRVNHPGYFLQTTEEAAALIGEVNSPNVKVLYDVYHQQVTEGNLIPNIRANMDVIDYFHIADHPGRHEIGTGEINYGNVLRAIQETGFAGYIGLEYFPSAEATETLRQLLRSYGSFVQPAPAAT
ncbi:hydroxypyruvate isomerase family protein [Paenibacillus sacheonensis]|uniref:TIM barrel protein n=1 Tax=Paenibacillus sacheonensis TaxID=742054 RepID=A0A7X4YNF0_9BACL|nr:TIM barrel protein [Paenibacillus sacheonensis]NBC69552.1 TIM barrel protein [Paenibacillus sacheonensis]